MLDVGFIPFAYQAHLSVAPFGSVNVNGVARWGHQHGTVAIRTCYDERAHKESPHAA
jgi:hypothetical protein